MQGIRAFIKQQRARIAATPWHDVYAEIGDYFFNRLLFSQISVGTGGSAAPYLFTVQSHSAKLVHNEDVTEELEQVVMYLLPHRLSGVVNTCTHSSKGCRFSCLHSAGRLGLPPAERAKLARTLFLHQEPWWFCLQLVQEIEQHRRRVERKGRRLVVRLNGTSDIPWEQFFPELFELFPNVLFQDYTKDWDRIPTAIPNYYLVASANETTSDAAFACHDGNVVVPVAVRRGDPLPDTFMGRPVVDGDLHDLRLIDPQIKAAVLVRAKGMGTQDTSGFIREVTA